MRPDGDSDLLASEPEPSRIGRSLRGAQAWRIAACVLLVLAIAALGLAWHYRTEAKTLRVQGSKPPVGAVTPRTLPPPLQVRMTAAQVVLRAGRIHGAVRFTLTTDPTARLTHGQLAVSAVLHGVPPGSHVALTGGPCQGSSLTRTWAKGKADSAGLVVLQGPVVRIATDRDYYLELDPWRLTRNAVGRETTPPGVNFIGANVNAFPPGGQPCL